MSNMELIPFHFESNEVRIIKDSHDQPWFIAKDVCAALEHSNYRMAVEILEEDEVRKVYITDSVGRKQETLTINESGLYALIMRSNKPKAKIFRKWITSEVIPSIRKTGEYKLSNNKSKISAATDDLNFTANQFKGAKRLARELGLKGNQLLLSARMAVKNKHNEDVFELLNVKHLLNESQIRQCTPSDLGLRINLSGKAFNKLLAEQGFQEETRDHKNRLVWKHTAKGEPYAVLADTNKKHSDGTPVLQLMWLESIMEAITKPESKNVSAVESTNNDLFINDEDTLEPLN